MRYIPLNVLRTQVLWSDRLVDKDKVKQPIYDLCFNPAGTQLLACSGPHILVYNPVNGELQSTVKAHKDTIFCLDYASDGQRFASGAADRTVIIWNNQLEGVPYILTSYNFYFQFYRKFSSILYFLLYISSIYDLSILYLSSIYPLSILYLPSPLYIISSIYLLYIIYIGSTYTLSILYISSIYHLYIIYIGSNYPLSILKISSIYPLYVLYHK